ncbi:MAG TPA: heavy metal translocating P-type ATPase, partial [Acidimicrobiales bacterium]|nr:heavy metal translocating P-type ATPase [Acidimicrobiales bacterium]
RRFWWSLLLSLPVVLTSEMVMDWFGYELDFPGIDLVGPVLGTVIFLWAGWPFLSGGWDEAQRRQPGMMLLIAMAITVAYGASMATSLGWFDLEFWWELAALITIMLLGHWQEMKALGQAQSALAALAELLPDDAERIDPATGQTTTVGLDELRAGDLVLVRPGARVPADGAIVEGEAEIDESMVTGESRPVGKGPGDAVVAGTVATDSSLRVRVEAVGDETTLAGIQRLVAEAQASRSRAQALADRFAALLFYVAAGSGVLTFVVWMALGSPDDAVVRTVTVLVIACPHALGLAIPLVVALSSALAARAGILVKDRLALERMRTVDAILFDKTGTLTTGRHTVAGVAAVPDTRTAAAVASVRATGPGGPSPAVGSDGEAGDAVLRIAAAVEADSEHPLARAIVAAGQAKGRVPAATDFRSIPGRGVEATVDGTRHAVGGPALLRERGLTEPEALRATTEGWRGRGAAVLYLVGDDEIVGALALEDTVRPEAAQAVAELHRRGKRVVMITGDAQQVADTVGRELGVDEVMAEVLPEDKDAKVAELQARGLSVAMVGDGVNDAPALARADVGLAIGAGTDVAIESAGVVLASSDPRAVVSAIELSVASYRKMVQNLVWAAGYNVLAIPLAAGVLTFAGITLSPAVGAVLMSLSTIVVALNAQLLRRLDLRPAENVRPA